MDLQIIFQKFMATISELKKPRGRLTPYACYVLVVMERCRKKYPDKNLIFSRFEKVCSERWKQMSDFHKIRFEQMSKTDGERYDREMKVYNKQVVAVYKELLDEGKEEKKKVEIKQKGALKKEEKKKELKEKKAAKKGKLEKKKQKKKKKDPNAPKGAKSSYMWFAKETRAELLAENPNISVPEVGKECGRRWKELSPSEKSKYVDMAAKDKERYQMELAKYEAEKEAEQTL